MAEHDQLVALARQAAAAANVYPEVICGICERESSWEPWTIRYEAAFYERYIVPLQLPDPTEARARGFSWGLMQTMGQVAREAGYAGRLAALCDPDISLAVGCKVFTRKLYVADGNVAHALQLWNGGANPNYGAEVLALAAKYS